MFELPEMNVKETKINAKRLIKTFKLAYFKMEMAKTPNITTNFSIVPPSNTNQFHSSTEDAVIFRDEYSRLVNDFVERFNRLETEAREVIYYSYILDNSHVAVALKLCVSTSQLSNMKHEALIELAIVFNCEVYR